MNLAMRRVARNVLVALAVLVAFVGPAFWPMYLGKPAADVDLYTHAHAALGTAWLSLLATQAWLVHRGRLSWHRSLGRVSYVLAPAFVASGLLVAHYRFSTMTEARFQAEANWLYLPLAIGLLFAAAWLLGIAYRHHWPVHARFMACTAVVMLDPVFGRVMAFYLPPLAEDWHYQAITFGATALVVFALFRRLPREGPGGAASRAYVGLTAVVLATFFFLAPTGAWRAFGSWFRALPMT